MTDLLVDLGNTRMKWAQYGPAQWTHSAVLHRGRELDKALDDAWRELPKPARVFFVSVVADDRRAALEAWMHRRWGINAYRLMAQREQLGVINTYRDPSALGADRWAALLGARSLTARACAVVSCGTAVTVDALSAEGVFAGGVILAGLSLQRQSLGAGTAGIGTLEGDHSNCLARTTGDGVAAGSLYGLAGAIERILKEQARTLDSELELIMTGGDAPVVMSHLGRSALHVPDLVLKGLARAADDFARPAQG
jgi:type III pantothenate kinase